MNASHRRAQELSHSATAGKLETSSHRGADPNLRASIRARLEEGHGGGPLREYRGVTPLGWGEQYQARIFVGRGSIRLIEARGGGR
jgi:hypothetical protein